MDDVRPVLRVATARRRLAGRLLDVCAVVASCILIIFGTTYLPMTMTDDISDGLLVGILATTFTATAASFVVLRIGLVAWWGCTAGQRAVGLRVVDQAHGTPVRGWRVALRRWFIVRGPASLGPVDDLATMLGDRTLRRCDHDRRAGTVVVHGPYERGRRVASGVVLAVLVLGAAGSVLGLAADPERQPAFAVDTFHDDRPHFEVRSPTGRSATFDRTAGRVLNDRKGCRAGAVDGRVRGLLAGLGCQGRIEVAVKTSDGVVLAAGHVLRFRDEAAASWAAANLRWTDLRFVPGGPVRPPGKISDGRLDHQGRYVVVTSVVAPEGPGMAEKAKNALILLHVPTVNTIIWL